MNLLLAMPQNKPGVTHIPVFSGTKFWMRLPLLQQRANLPKVLAVVPVASASSTCLPLKTEDFIHGPGQQSQLGMIGIIRPAPGYQGPTSVWPGGQADKAEN